MATNIVQNQIYTIRDNRTHRLRARTINLDYLIQHNRDLAADRKQTTYTVRHGGSVPNSYGYPSQTECGAVVSIYADGIIFTAVYADQISANKVTLSGCVALLLGNDARPIFDRRYSSGAKELAKTTTELLVCKNILNELNVDYLLPLAELSVLADQLEDSENPICQLVRHYISMFSQPANV